MLTNQIQFLLYQIILIKKVDNNSDKWSFENYKKLKNYPSTPVSKNEF